MDPGAAQRYLRQIALPEVGPDGQQRLSIAVIAVAAQGRAGDGGGDDDIDDVTAEVAARYLAAAGVGTVRLIARAAACPFADSLRASNPDMQVQTRPWPDDGAAWMAALCGVDLVVRSGFDDDPMLRAAVRLGIPAVVLRAGARAAEVISFRRHGPCPHLDLAIPPRAAEEAPDSGGAAPGAGAGGVVAGTLGAAEALFTLLGQPAAPAAVDTRAARARHLSLPLDGGAPRAQEIPWSPECFACGGGAVEMVFP